MFPLLGCSQTLNAPLLFAPRSLSLTSSGGLQLALSVNK